MALVQRLPSDLANQIAAGEVVERPASVVKELVENALDAGATRVKVQIELGGVALVRVSDDGSGMDAEDAALSLERHATSKITSKDDLFALRTFGFRGEALPSIASIGKLRLLTRRRGAPEGTEILVEGGAPSATRPAGVAEGTSVEVRDLFFNVPARRKFLKATATEAAHVSEVMLMAALARPDVSFFLMRDGRSVREWLRVTSRRDRAAQTIDGEQLEACLGERGPMRVEAHLASPERARAGAVALHILVNGRPVRDRQLARAVAHAYGSVLEPGRYPVGVVYVDVPPEQVDINVHPQKAEVRFSDARALFDAVSRELHAGLARAFSVPSLGSSRAWSTGVPTTIPPPFGPDSTPVSSDPWRLAAADDEPRERPNPERTTLPSPAPLAELAAEMAEPGLFRGVGFYSSLHFLAQLRATFLLCSGSDGLYILDQHAAAERLTYHRLRTAFFSRSIPTQRLLVPEVVDLEPAEIAAIEERANDVASLGVELRAIGPNAVAVHAMPTLLLRAAPERVVRDLVAELMRTARRPFTDAADLVLATMACHGSVRAGDMLSPAEALALLRGLDEVDFAGHCPHGRPVVTRLGYDELERRVGR
jgi:DNA mismatch repair protein MutL